MLWQKASGSKSWRIPSLRTIDLPFPFRYISNPFTVTETPQGKDGGWEFLARLARQSQLDFFPVRKALKGYSKTAFSGDAMAGINVALLTFPQGMAYAMIAGLPVEYGLFGSAIASVLGTMFSGSKFIVLGPTNATSVMMLSTFSTLGALTLAQKAAVIPSMLFMVGVFLTVGAMFRMASMIQFVSRTVVTGYVMAAALLIMVNQVKNLVGFQVYPGEKAVTFLDVSLLTFQKLTGMHWEALETWYPIILGAGTLGIYLALQKRLPTLPNVALALIMGSVLHEFAHAWFPGSIPGIEMLASPEAGGIRLSFPAFEMEQMRMLIGAAVAMSLLCLLEGLSIGKLLAARQGKRLDANQEMFGLGIANLGCSVLGGMAASGSLTRSALNANCGAKTQVSSLFCGGFCMAGILTIGKYISHVPKTCLAIMIMVIGYSLFNRKQYRMVTHSTISDAVVFWVTFVSGLVFALDFAIYVGVGASIILYLRKAAAPQMVEYGFNDKGQLQELATRKRSDMEISIVHVEGELFFGAADFFLEQTRRFCADPNLKVVILKMRNARNMDATSCMAMEELVRYMRKSEQHILVCEVKDGILKVLKKSGLWGLIGEENLFLDDSKNPTLSAAKAVRRAKQIVGTDKMKVSIYVDSVKAPKPDGGEGKGSTN